MKIIRFKKQSISVFINENIFSIFSIWLVIGFSFSESLLSISVGLLFLQALLVGNWKAKSEILRHDRALWALTGVFFIYLLGCLFCKDISTGLYELKKNIFWFIIPVSVALSASLSSKKIWIILTVFVSSVTLAAIITTVKIIFPHQFNITDVRDASYVSHVSFSLQVIFSVFILWYSNIKKTPVLGKINISIIFIWCLSLVVFLGFQKSLIGILSLYGTSIVFIFYLAKGIKNHKRKSFSFTLLALIIAFPFAYVGWIATQYFNIIDHQPDNKITTESGNQYSFDFQNKQKENGHYVYWYICNAELEKSWNNVSALKINDIDASGYSIYNTLIRYMTSKGIRKDSTGVSRLTDADIKNVQAGISNYLFIDKKFSFYPRVYQTIWEIDTYFNTGNPNDQSLSQRIEFTKAALYIIKNNFWGIGTGNFIIEFDNAYKKTNSKLDEKFRFNVHNQYLNYTVKFGILGFILILFFVVSAVRLKNQFKNVILNLLLLIIFFSNFGETTLETHVGLPFFLFFLSLFLWHQEE